MASAACCQAKLASRPSAMRRPSDAPAPVVGQRLSVYWTKPKEYFDGRIISVSQQLGSGRKKSNYSVEVLWRDTL